jgi:hypothetical protein
MSNNPIVMWELASHDQEKTVEFLGRLFDWGLEFDEDLGFYITQAEPADREKFFGGGVFTLGKARLPFLTVYIQVEDIAEKAREIEKLGGYIVEAPHEIPGGAKICLFNEPSGVTLAMVEPSSSSRQQ